jgi:hypothetical protein
LAEIDLRTLHRKIQQRNKTKIVSAENLKPNIIIIEVILALGYASSRIADGLKRFVVEIQRPQGILVPRKTLHE